MVYFMCIYGQLHTAASGFFLRLHTGRFKVLVQLSPERSKTKEKTLKMNYSKLGAPHTHECDFSCSRCRTSS